MPVVGIHAVKKPGGGQIKSVPNHDAAQSARVAHAGLRVIQRLYKPAKTAGGVCGLLDMRRLICGLGQPGSRISEAHLKRI
jgi:hypothetical protein